MVYPYRLNGEKILTIVKYQQVMDGGGQMIGQH